MPEHKHISFLRAYWPAIVWGTFILIATLLPGKSLPQTDLWKFDKLIHLGIFFLFAWLSLRGVYFRVSASLSKTNYYLFIGIGSILYGIMIEGIQHYIPGRAADLNDVIANTSGILLAQILFYFTHRTTSAS